MKKLISIILTAAMLLTVCPAAFAADAGSMEQALLAVKAKVAVPEELSEFSYSASTDGYGTAYEFSWATPEGAQQYRNLSITAWDNGIITRYSYYDRQYSGKSEPGFLKMTTQQAKAKAEEYLTVLNGEIADQLEISEMGFSGLYSDSHDFRLTRTHNGIPVPANTGRISVRDSDGALDSFYMTWWPNATFEDSMAADPANATAEAYDAAIGLKPVYLAQYKDGQQVPYLAYIPAKSGMVDAVTGEVTEPGQPGDIDFGYSFDLFNSKAENATGNAAPTLSPEEIAQLETMESLLSAEEGDQAVRATGVLMVEGMTVNGSSYYKSGDGYTLNLQYRGDNGRANVVLDAKNGQIKSFYAYLNQNDAGKAVDATAGGDALAALLGDKAKSFEQSRANSDNGNFSYTRMVNGIETFDNASVSIDGESGKVISFNYSWTEANFPSPDGIITAKEAAQKLFEQADFSLRYINGQDNVQHQVLAYAFDQSIEIDPFTGKAKDFTIRSAVPEFTDLDGHYAKDAIVKLAQNGIYFDSEQVQPDAQITQGEYLTLLQACFEGMAVALVKDMNTASVYSYMTRSNILTATEAAPDSPLTRGDAVKFLVRAMGAERYASIEGIYNCPFSDVQSLKGHISIAAGMGIVSGDGSGLFHPDDHMTRAEAMMVIYNYLNRH